MSKFIKVLSIILIIYSLVLSFYSVYASDINMNLTSNDGIVAENNTMADNTNSSVNQTIEDIETDDIVDTLSDTDTSTQPTSIGSVSEEGLSFSNVLSILLITVGVVLILLAIAIIIKLK